MKIKIVNIIIYQLKDVKPKRNFESWVESEVLFFLRICTVAFHAYFRLG